MSGEPENNSPIEEKMSSLELESNCAYENSEEICNTKGYASLTSDDAENSKTLLSKSAFEMTKSRLYYVMDYFRRHPLQAFILVILILAGIVGLDLYLFYKHMKSPIIRSINVNLDPSNSDAQVSVDAQMKTHSATTSFALNDGQCDFYYRKNEETPFTSGGEITFSFPKITSDTVDVVADIRQSNFPILRRIQWDIESMAVANSSVKMDCSITLTAKVYGMLPVTKSFSFAPTVDLDAFQYARLNKKKKLHDGNALVMSRIAIEPQSVTTTHMDLEVLIKVPKKLKKQFTAYNGGHKIDSFTVELPKISYVTSTVDRSRNGAKAYLKVRTKATTLDLMAHHKPLKLDLKVSCTTRTLGAPHTSGEDQCSLLSALNAGTMHQELSEHSFINITSYSTNENFLSNFLGNHHYMRTVDNSLYPGNQMEQEERRQLASTSLVPLGVDPSISQGAKCVTVDSDGVYISQACATIQKGFFDLYVDIYSTDSHAGYIQTSTSWSTSGPLAWVSQLDGSVDASGTMNKFYGHSTFSETWQNLTFTVGFNQSADSRDKTLFLEALTAKWNFPQGGASGMIDVDSLTIVSGSSPYRVDGAFEYGNDHYSGDVRVSNNKYVNNGEVFTVAGQGQYGGNWNAWHLSLNESVLISDNSTIGHATGEVAYDVPANPVTGALGFKFDVTDGTNAPFTSSNYTVLEWYSGDYYDDDSSSWSNTGTVVLTSLYDLYGNIGSDTPSLTWNATGYFNYDSGDFTLYAVENPWTPSSTGGIQAHSARLSAPDSLHVENPKTIVQLPTIAQRSRALAVSAYQYQDQFLLFGSGTYDCGSSFGSVTLVNSAVVVSEALVGGATGVVSYAVSGANGVVNLAADLTNNNYEVWESTIDQVTWTTESDWNSAGSVVVTSQLFGEAANWNASLNFGYGDNAYSVIVTELPYGYVNDDDSSPYTLYAAGNGGYGGSSAQNWWVSLEQSKLIYNEATVGYASGGVKVDIPQSSGVNGLLQVYSQVENANHQPQVQGMQSLMWSTENQWISSGDIQVMSQYYMLSGINWNASGVFEYGDNQYKIRAMENDYGVDNEEFLVYGLGGYGGSWSNWWATLDESELLVSASVVGYATGEISFESVASYTNSTFTFKTDVTNGNDALALSALEQLSWNSPASWANVGNIELESVLMIPGIIWYNTTGQLEFVDGSYSFNVDEFDSINTGSAVPQDHVQVFGNGVYSGDFDAWSMSVLSSTLLYNSGLLGTATGTITGYTPDGGTRALITYSTDSNNKYDNMVLSTDGSIEWVSPSFNYASTAYFALKSVVDMPSVVNWNASGLFEYGNNAYYLSLHEQALNSGNVYFNTYAEGGYGGSSATQAWMSITDSLVEVDSTVYANVRAYLSTNIPAGGENGLLQVNVVDYSGITQGPLYPSESYPVTNSVFWTNNGLSWYYDGEVTGGKLWSNTSSNAGSLFTVKSGLNVSLTADSATFYLDQTLNGAAGVDSTAHATYDMETGMIAEIGGAVYYANKLQFGYNTNYDLQLQDGTNPDAIVTSSPTVAPITAPPSLKPTIRPTQLPTTVGATNSPSAVPTLKPSARPTTAQTGAPSAVPSVTPSLMPSAAPTYALVQFSAAQVLSGINITTYNSNLAANQNAMLMSIAQCITGATTSNILDLTVTAPTSRRLADALPNLRVSVKMSAAAVAASSNSVNVNYVVSMATGASYATLSNDLSTNIANGNFNSYLTTNTVATGGSPALSTSTSYSVTTANLDTDDNSSNDDSSSNGLSTGAIVGIAIGGAVVLFGAIFAYYYFVVRGSSSSSNSNDAGTNQSSQAAASAAVASPIPVERSNKVSDPIAAPQMQQNPAYRSRISSASDSQTGSSFSPPRNSSLDGTKGVKRAKPEVEPTL